MTMSQTPNCIKASFVAFFFAYLCEAPVEVLLLWSQPLKPIAWPVAIASLTANLLALIYAMKRRKWGFDLLKGITACTVSWTVFGSP